MFRGVARAGVPAAFAAVPGAAAAAHLDARSACPGGVHVGPLVESFLVHLVAAFGAPGMVRRQGRVGRGVGAFEAHRLAGPAGDPVERLGLGAGLAEDAACPPVQVDDLVAGACPVEFGEYLDPPVAFAEDLAVPDQVEEVVGDDHFRGRAVAGGGVVFPGRARPGCAPDGEVPEAGHGRQGDPGAAAAAPFRVRHGDAGGVGGEGERAEHPPVLQREEHVDVLPDRRAGFPDRFGGRGVGGALGELEAGTADPGFPAVEDDGGDAGEGVHFAADEDAGPERYPDRFPGPGCVSQGALEAEVGGGEFFEAGDDPGAARFAERAGGQAGFASAGAVGLGDEAGAVAQFGGLAGAGMLAVLMRVPVHLAHHG